MPAYWVITTTTLSSTLFARFLLYFLVLMIAITQVMQLIVIIAGLGGNGLYCFLSYQLLPPLPTTTKLRPKTRVFFTFFLFPFPVVDSHGGVNLIKVLLALDFAGMLKKW